MNMATITKKQLSMGIAKQLAGNGFSDKDITAITDRMMLKDMEIGRVRVCPLGICGDFFSNKYPDLKGFAKYPGITKWEVFPYGILDWDRFHVRVTFDANAIKGNFNAARPRG